MRQVVNKDNVAELIFPGKLLSLSESELTNINGKNYKVGTIEFVNAQGELVERSCQIYEGNYSKGMSIGSTYRATAKRGDDGQRYIQLSHLPMSGNASVEDFPDELFVVSETPTEVANTVTIGGEVL